MSMDVIKINPKDNVAVALHPLRAGQNYCVDGSEIVSLADISFGHKIALKAIPKDTKVIKYGHPIGYATKDIKPGDHVHTDNIKTGLKEHQEYTYRSMQMQKQDGNTSTDFFMGFKRKNGKVGIRNEIWIVPTVGCVNFIAEAIAKKAQALLSGNIQGVYSFPHPYGCSQLGEDHENTKKILSGLIKHPNAGGVLLLGLGCENNSMKEMKEELGKIDENRVKFLVCQDVENEVDSALKLIAKLIENAKNDTRTKTPVSELIVGLKCGGSDGLSGVTANPLVGAFTDALTFKGGSTILTEVPEMFGAEQILMNRCKNQDIFNKTVLLINSFKEYFTSHNQPVYENPSPGNKEGGISTLEDKALGATQKSGNATVVDVLQYGQSLNEKGLNLLESPGNDIVAVTALAACGAHIILFTTGRGTPLGAPVPVVKIASNSELYERKNAWIDFSAGDIADGVPIEKVAKNLYDFVLELASGEKHTKNEDYGFRDLAIFKTGVTL